MLKNFLKSALLIGSMISTFANAELIINSASSPVAVNSIINRNQMPTDPSVQKLMQVLHINEMIEGIVNQQQVFATAMADIPKQLPPTDSKKSSIFSRHIEKQIQQLFGKYSQVFANSIDPEKQRQAMTNAYLQVAKRHYTQAEVDALIRFYDNPIGQQILQKQNQVNSDFMQTVMPILAGDTAVLQKNLPQIQQDIEKIFHE